jgi:flagellar basal body-associated protein FliL
MSDVNNQTPALEEIDKLLNQEDPNFNASLENIKKDAIENTTEIESLDVEVDEASTLEQNSEKISFKKKITHFFMRPFIWIGNWVKLRWMAFVYRLKLSGQQTKHFIKHDLPDLIRFSISQIKAGLKFLKSQISKFIALKRSQKLALLGSLLAGLAAVLFLSKSLTGQWLPVWKNPLIRGLHEQASFVKAVESEKEYVEFFSMFPEVEFYLQLSRIVVNLKPSQGIPNPMGAFEFYLGLDANETAIEIKDREKEVLDIAQRTLEGFSYPEIMSQNTQKRVWARIRDNINEVLNQGRVQRVYVKTMLTYRQ